VDIGSHEPGPCLVVVHLENGKWVRANPTKPGTFDCNPKNIKAVKMELEQ
jgi:hypothetical protein